MTARPARRTKGTDMMSSNETMDLVRLVAQATATLTVLVGSVVALMIPVIAAL